MVFEVEHMAGKLTDADARNLIEAYRSGLPYKACAERFGISAMTAWKIIRDAGAGRDMSTAVNAGYRKLRASLVDEVVLRFDRGESVKAIAVALGVTDRRKIAQCLNDAGRSVRNRRQAMLLRMERSSPEERAALSAAAHGAIRSTKQSDIHARRRAVGNAHTLCRVGSYEADLIDALASSGKSAIPQFPVENRNIDIMVWPVAVEIHVNSGNPVNLPYTRRRIEQLTDRGLHVLYVWITPSHPFDAHAACRDVVAFYESVKRLPPGIGQYRVIRGSGKLVTAGCGDLH